MGATTRLAALLTVVVVASGCSVGPAAAPSEPLGADPPSPAASSSVSAESALPASSAVPSSASGQPTASVQGVRVPWVLPPGQDPELESLVASAFAFGEKANPPFDVALASLDKGDLAGFGSGAALVGSVVADAIEWLDRHPPLDCYRALWAAQRDYYRAFADWAVHASVYAEDGDPAMAEVMLADLENGQNLFDSAAEASTIVDCPADQASSGSGGVASYDPAGDVSIAEPFRLAVIGDQAGQRVLTALASLADNGERMGARYVKNGRFGEGFFAYLFVIDLSAALDPGSVYDEKVRRLTAAAQAETRDVDGIKVTSGTSGTTGIAMYLDGDEMIVVTCADRSAVPSIVDALIAAR